MSKKIFAMVENDWTVREKIYDRIHGKQFGGFSKIDTQQASQIINEMFAVLADYELNVIGFEAEVTTIPFETGRMVSVRSWLDAIRVPVEVMEQLNLQGDKKIQVLVVKKPEVK